MMSESPLLSTDPDSLTRLFEADPMSLSDADILTAITELRRRRNAFASEEASKSLKPKATRTKAESVSAPKAAALDKPVGEISLADL